MNVVDKIRGFANLPDGWHLGGGGRPTPARIENAVLHAIVLSSNFDELDAFPGPGGEILLKAFIGESERVELTFDSDETFTLAYEIGGQDEFYKDGLSRSEMIVYLNEVLRRIWFEECRRTSGYSTLFTTSTQKTVASRISPLDLGLMTRVNNASLVSARRAESKLAGVSANIFRDTTRVSQPLPQSSGGLQSPRSVEAA